MLVEYGHDIEVGASHRREERDRQDDEILNSGTHAASPTLVRPGCERRDHGGAVFVALERRDLAF